MDSDPVGTDLVALDAQIISQLRDTNIQINRLMVLQLNRLHDTIRQLHSAESDTSTPDPRLPGRIQQLQTLLPSLKATVEHQQTFYHQCLRLQHIPTTLQHQVLRLATTLDKTHTTSTSTFERSNTPPSPRQPKTDPPSLTTKRPPIRLHERPHQPQHHKLSEQPLPVRQQHTSTAASHSHSAKHTHKPPQRSRSHSRHTRQKRQVAAPRRHSDRTSPPRIAKHNSPHSHSTRSPQQPQHLTKHTKHRKQPKRSQHSTSRSRRSRTRRSRTTRSRRNRRERSTRSAHHRSSCRTRRQLSPAPTRTHSPSHQTEHHTSRHSSRASPTTRPDSPRTEPPPLTPTEDTSDSVFALQHSPSDKTTSNVTAATPAPFPLHPTPSQLPPPPPKTPPIPAPLRILPKTSPSTKPSQPPPPQTTPLRPKPPSYPPPQQLLPRQVDQDPAP